MATRGNPTPEHGTRARYRGSEHRPPCRCDSCVEAHRAYWRAWQAGHREHVLEYRRAYEKRPYRREYMRSYRKRPDRRKARKQRDAERYRVAKGLDLRWATLTPVGRDLGLSWNVRQTVGRSLEARWRTNSWVHAGAGCWLWRQELNGRHTWTIHYWRGDARPLHLWCERELRRRLAAELRERNILRV